MKELAERIIAEGIDLGGGILKVDSFLNHQVDPILLFHCGKALAGYFYQHAPTKILTAEISGIAPALMAGLELGIPVVYARKHKPITMANGVFLATAPSHTKGGEITLMVSGDFLKPNDRVLVIDDFLASGETIVALARLVKAARATLIGFGAVIEKAFEGGREKLKPWGVPVFALSRILSMDSGKITVEDS